jgi:hypothetical protein
LYFLLNLLFRFKAMKFIATNCLKHHTVINQVLEPHWGELELKPRRDGIDEHYMVYDTSIDGDSDFKIWARSRYCHRFSSLSITVLGIHCYVPNRGYTLYEMFEICMNRLELLFVEYSSPNAQFYHYPVFTLLQALKVMINVEESYHIDTKWNGYKITFGIDIIHIINITHNGKEIMNVDVRAYTDTDLKYKLNSLIEEMIDGTAPENYYVEGAISHTKSARLKH